MLIKTSQLWELSIGRFVALYYGTLRGVVEAPWLIGILSLVYISFSVFFTMRLFGFDYIGWKVFVVAAIYVLNISNIINVGVYIYCWDMYMLALLLAVLGVYLYSRIENWLGFLSSSIFIALCLGIYQSYIGVVIGLFILLIVLKILNHTEIKFVIKKAISYMAIVLCAGVLYRFLVWILQRIYGVSLYEGAYNSISSMSNFTASNIVIGIPIAYKQVIRFLCMDNVYASVTVECFTAILLITGGFIWIRTIINIQENISKIIIVFLLFLFPLCINVTSILTNGRVYALMQFPFQLVYILILYPILSGSVDFSIKSYIRFLYIAMPILVILISLGVVRYSNDCLYHYKLMGEGTRVHIAESDGRFCGTKRTRCEASGLTTCLLLITITREMVYVKNALHKACS